MTIGGTLTNTSTNGKRDLDRQRRHHLGRHPDGERDGRLSNTGQIDIIGSATVQSTLNIANAAAGFGTAGVETGTVFLQNDALLEFKSGQITTVDGELRARRRECAHRRRRHARQQQRADRAHDGRREFLAAERRVGQPDRRREHHRQRRVELDGNNAGGCGGSSLTIGGTLTNSSTNGNAHLDRQRGITSADTVTVNGTGGLSSTGEINIEGSATVQSTLDIANAAAGFGTAGMETGTVFLQNDALLEFNSGQITTVNGALQLDGANARIADAGTLDQQQRADRAHHASPAISGCRTARRSPDRQREHHRQRHARARRQQRWRRRQARASRSAAT